MVTAPTLETPTLVGDEPVDAEPRAEDLRLWSVTTIGNALAKQALIPWAARETAEAAIRSVDAWRAIEESSGTEEAVRWLTQARYRPPRGSKRTAAELGTAVHKAAEEYALTGKRPDVDPEVRPYLDRFDEWLQRFTPSYQAVETTVYNETYGYAGTADAFLTIDGVRLIADYKTSRKSVDRKGNPTHPWPEVALQLAPYRYAERAAVWRPRKFESFRRRYYLLSSAERAEALPVPEVDGGVCIYITPEHAEAYPVRCDEAIFAAYLYVLEAARWSFELSRQVIGEPLTLPLDH
jgi:hypothetical protein